MIFPVAFLLILLPITTALPPETTANAADTLLNSGYVAMSLTLNLVSNSLLSHINSGTVFTPPDAVFSNSGQPSHSLLRFHISPLFFSLSALQSLPSGTGIPTLLSDKHLIITSTSASHQISINNVNIIGSPVFDDGLLIIYEIESFFNREFRFSDDDKLNRKRVFNDCETGERNVSFYDAGNVLKSRGYSVMASFLNLQLLGFQSFQSHSQRSLTIFAPADDVMIEYSSRFPDYASVFLRHVLPCKISWKELSNIESRVSVNTFLEGFEVGFSRSGGSLMVNDVPIAFPDMYYSDWLVIHGVSRVISLTNPTEDEDDSDLDSDSVPNFDSSGKEMKADATTIRTEF